MLITKTLSVWRQSGRLGAFSPKPILPCSCHQSEHVSGAWGDYFVFLLTIYAIYKLFTQWWQLRNVMFLQLDNLYVRSLVKEINGHTIGLVGYITPHTKFISNSGKVENILAKEGLFSKLMLSGHFHGRNRIIAKGGCWAKGKGKYFPWHPHPISIINLTTRVWKR